MLRNRTTPPLSTPQQQQMPLTSASGMIPMRHGRPMFRAPSQKHIGDAPLHPQRIQMAIGQSNYRITLFIAAGAIFVGFCVVILLSLTISTGSGAGAGGGRFLTPAPPITSPSSVTLPVTTTSTSSAAVSTTTTATMTTTTPLVPISIVCPPDISLVYGKPYDQGTIANIIGRDEPNAFVNATGGCSSPLTITVTDTTIDSIAGVTKKDTDSLIGKPPLIKTMPKTLNGALYSATVALPSVGRIKKRKRSLYGSKRTPTFPNASGTTLSDSQVTLPTNTAEVDPSMASNEALGQVAWITNKAGVGTLVTVTQAEDVSNVLLSFELSSLAPAGPCDTGLDGDRASVVYDQFQGVWVFMERSATQNSTCFYVSDSGDITSASWAHYQVDFNDVETRYSQLTLWGRYYLLTYDAYPQTSPHCFVEKSTFDVLCFTDGYSNLAGYTEQTWTPLHMEGDLPSALVEDLDTNTGGGVFVRLVDDELHQGASTPGFDLIDFVHYSNLNFTLQTVNALRYVVSVTDFDGSNTTIKRVDLIAPRAVFRFLPECDDKAALVLTFATPDGLRWAEFGFGIVLGIVNRFALVQQGRLDNEAYFLPSIGITANGTILLVFSDTQSTYITMRAVDDPMGFMRTPFVLDAGTSDVSGRSMAVVGKGNRQFYVASLYNGNSVQGHRIKVLGEVVERVFVATDSCGQTATCSEMIRLE